MPTTPIRKVRIQTPGSETPVEVPIGAYAEDILMSDAVGADDLVTELAKKLEASDLPSDFVGATSSTAGTHGLVPAPAAGDEAKFLQGDGTWAAVAGGVTSVNGKTGAVTLDTSDIGAVSTAAIGTASGVAELDANGKVPTAQLPSYVDDVIEGYYNTTDGKFYEESTYTTEITGETGKIYVSLDTNKSYRWSGSAFVEISASLALGETDSTAYRGDRGKAAYDHATESGKVSSAISAGFYKVGVTAEGHISTAEAVTKSDLTALGVSALENVVDGPANMHSVIEGAVSSGTLPDPTDPSQTVSYEANIATGMFSHTEGLGTSAIGDYSHAEGTSYILIPSDNPHELEYYEYDDSEGIYFLTNDTVPNEEKDYHIINLVEDIDPECDPSDEGFLEVKDSTSYIFTEDQTVIDGKSYYYSDWANVNYGEITLGTNIANGIASHVEGFGNIANEITSHAEGYKTSANGFYSHAEGYYSSASGESSHAEGYNTSANGNNSHAEGNYTLANGYFSHAEGNYTLANANDSHAEGSYTTANGYFSHTEGYHTSTSGESSHAEGGKTIANGNSAHAEGGSTTAQGYYSHSEGYNTLAKSYASHAEGNETSAKYDFAHAEGNQTLASGSYGSHAEGCGTSAQGISSHAEGYNTSANGSYSHAEGNGTSASGDNSHSQNEYTIAQGLDQTVIGKYNVAQGTPTSSVNTDYAFIIGNGTADNARSNAFGIKWNGNFVLADGTELTPSQIASEGKEYEAVTTSVGAASGWNAGSITNAAVSGDTLTLTLGVAPTLTVTSTTVATGIQEKTTP